jgi:hypothetical protein
MLSNEYFVNLFCLKCEMKFVAEIAATLSVKQSFLLLN